MRKREGKEKEKIRNKDIVHSENHGGAEWPERQEHSLGVKNLVLTKVVERKRGRDLCMQEACQLFHV